jgi:hypothetical protein
MSVTRYHFAHAVNAFFEMPSGVAGKLLPGHLQPLELRHDSAIFAVTAFDFTDSLVGAYQELVLAVIVPPMVKAGGVFPKSAFFPFLLGTSTEASRKHAIARWHLPHHMADIDLDFDVSKDGVQILVHESDKPILDMQISVHDWTIVDQLYQCFMIDADKRYKVDIHMQGRFTEHEEESGSLKLHPHAMTANLSPERIATYPFREMWMRDGLQTFEELESI